MPGERPAAAQLRLHALGGPLPGYPGVSGDLMAPRAFFRGLAHCGAASVVASRLHGVTGRGLLSSHPHGPPSLP
jgi:hypothetical protein